MLVSFIEKFGLFRDYTTLLACYAQIVRLKSHLGQLTVYQKPRAYEANDNGADTLDNENYPYSSITCVCEGEKRQDLLHLQPCWYMPSPTRIKERQYAN